MLALGIDPGTAICGFGFVSSEGSRLVPHAYGALTTSPKARMEDRLMKLYDGLDALIKEYKPDVMGIDSSIYTLIFAMSRVSFSSTAMSRRRFPSGRRVASCFWLRPRMAWKSRSIRRCRSSRR